MMLTFSRRAGAALAVAAGALALVTLAASPAAAASPVFCGAGYGPSRDVAIQSALEDAQLSAQSEGFYGSCTIVDGTVFVGEVSNPLYGTRITASLSVTCDR